MDEVAWKLRTALRMVALPVILCVRLSGRLAKASFVGANSVR